LLATLVGLLLYSDATLLRIILSILAFVILDFIFVLWSVINDLKTKTKIIPFDSANVVITGGSSGIGLALAKLFVSRGSNVILVARNEERLKKAVAECLELSKNGNKVAYVSMDITADPNVIKSQVEKIISDLGSIDILVNSAGFAIPGEFSTSPVTDFKVMMDTNYIGATTLTHAVVPHMIEKQFGQIVFMSSIAGQVACYGYGSYSPAKFALRGLAEVLTSELNPHNIGVTMVFPSDTQTPGFDVENSSKPEVTKLMSEAVTVWTAEDTAQEILKGIENRSRNVLMGADGFFAHALTCGASLPSSLLEFLGQVLLMPILRIYILFLQNSFANIVRKSIK